LICIGGWYGVRSCPALWLVRRQHAGLARLRTNLSAEVDDVGNRVAFSAISAASDCPEFLLSGGTAMLSFWPISFSMPPQSAHSGGQL
jgi:hypothetical protein